MQLTNSEKLYPGFPTLKNPDLLREIIRAMREDGYLQAESHLKTKNPKTGQVCYCAEGVFVNEVIQHTKKFRWANWRPAHEFSNVLVCDLFKRNHIGQQYEYAALDLIHGQIFYVQWFVKTKQAFVPIFVPEEMILLDADPSENPLTIYAKGGKYFRTSLTLANDFYSLNFKQIADCLEITYLGVMKNVR